MSQIFIEGTSLQQQRFDAATGEIPITVHDGGDGMTPAMLTQPSKWQPHQDRMHDDDPAPRNGAAMDPYAGASPVVVLDGPLTDPFADDTPIVASCDLSNPDICESCT
jgi:hypothetical protein